MTNNFVVDIDFNFNEPPKLEEIQWSILVGKENDRVRIIEHPDREMLFPGVNAGLLYSVYPTAKRYKNPNEVELTVRAAYAKGKAAELDWNSIPEWIKATGTITTTRVLVDLDKVVDFCDAISLELSRRGECRLVEFLLGDKMIADYISSGEREWLYIFYSQEFDVYMNKFWAQRQSCMQRVLSKGSGNT
jgi:hypothetical protein